MEEMSVVETVETEIEAGDGSREIVLTEYDESSENVLSSQSGSEQEVLGYLEVQPTDLSVDHENAAIFAQGIEIDGQHLILTQGEEGNEIIVVVSDNQENPSEHTISHFSQSIASTDDEESHTVLVRSNHIPLRTNAGRTSTLYASGLSNDGLEYEHSVVIPTCESSKGRFESGSKGEGIMWTVAKGHEKDDDTEVLFIPNASVLSSNHTIGSSLLAREEGNANRKLMELASVAQELQSDQPSLEVCEESESAIDSPATVEVIVQRQSSNSSNSHTVIAETLCHRRLIASGDYSNENSMDMYDSSEYGTSSMSHTQYVGDVANYADSNITPSEKISTGVSVIQLVSSSAFSDADDFTNRGSVDIEMKSLEGMENEEDNTGNIEGDADSDVSPVIQVVDESGDEAVETCESPNEAFETCELPNEAVETCESPNEAVETCESPNEAVEVCESPKYVTEKVEFVVQNKDVIQSRQNDTSDLQDSVVPVVYESEPCNKGTKANENMQVEHESDFIIVDEVEHCKTITNQDYTQDAYRPLRKRRKIHSDLPQKKYSKIAVPKNEESNGDIVKGNNVQDNQSLQMSSNVDNEMVKPNDTYFNALEEQIQGRNINLLSCNAERIVQSDLSASQLKQTEHSSKTDILLPNLDGELGRKTMMNENADENDNSLHSLSHNTVLQSSEQLSDSLNFVQQELMAGVANGKQKTSAILSEEICNGPKVSYVTGTSCNTAVSSIDEARESADCQTLTKFIVKDAVAQNKSGISICEEATPSKSNVDISQKELAKEVSQGSIDEPSCSTDINKRNNSQQSSDSLSTDDLIQETIIVPPKKTYTRKPKKLNIKQLNNVKPVDKETDVFPHSEDKDLENMQDACSNHASNIYSDLKEKLSPRKRKNVSTKTLLKTKKVPLSVRSRRRSSADLNSEEERTSRNAEESLLVEPSGEKGKKTKATELSSSLLKSEKRKNSVSLLEKRQNLTKSIKKSKLDSDNLGEKVANGIVKGKLHEDDYDPSNEYIFTESDEDSKLEKSYTELNSFKRFSSDPQHRKHRGRPLGSRNRITNTPETWEKLLKSSPAKIKSTPRYLTKLKKRLARTKPLSYERYPLPSMSTFSPFLNNGNVCKGKRAPVPPRKLEVDVTPEQRECLYSLLGDFSIYVMLQSSEPESAPCENKVYCCVSCHYETERLGNLMCHIKFCFAKGIRYEVSDMERRLKIRGNPDLSTYSLSESLCGSEELNRETFRREKNYNGEDDKDAASTTSENKPEFCEDDVVWVEWKRMFWPALVRRVYDNENRVSVVFIDFPNPKGSSQKVSMRKLQNFDNVDLNKKYLCEGKDTQYGETFVKAVQKAVEFARKRFLGMPITVAEFFGELKIADQSDAAVDQENDNGNNSSSAELADATVSVSDKTDGGHISDDDISKSVSELVKATDDALDSSSRILVEGISVPDVVKFVKDGEADAHVVGVYQGHVYSGRHSKFFSNDASQKGSLVEHPWFGPIEDVNVQTELYKHLSHLFKERFKDHTLKGTLRYIYQVWCPEAIIKAISVIKDVSLKEAESLFAMYGLEQALKERAKHQKDA